MKIIDLKKENESENYLNEFSEIIKKGGVVAYPSETCYGFLANYFDSKALEKVFKLKKRPVEKKLLVLVKDINEVEKIAKSTYAAKKLADKFWPGPLTLILPTESEETLAVRVPSHELSQKLLYKVGLPLISTSANLSGEDPPYTIDTIKKLEPDLILDTGEIEKNPPTTIVDTTSDLPKIIRLGKIAEKDILDE